MQWPPPLSETSIQIKEFVPLVVASALYGHLWANEIVQFEVDNQAVVEVVCATCSRKPHLMHLTRLLVFLAAKHSFWFSAVHIPGRVNCLADALSRDNLPFFLSQVPGASPQPPSIPVDLISLVSQDLNWTASTHWMDLFRNIIQQH